MKKHIFRAKDYPDGYFKMIGIVVDRCTNVYGMVTYPYKLDRKYDQIFVESLPSKVVVDLKDTFEDAGIDVEVKAIEF